MEFGFDMIPALVHVRGSRPEIGRRVRPSSRAARPVRARVPARAYTVALAPATDADLPQGRIGGSDETDCARRCDP